MEKCAHYLFLKPIKTVEKYLEQEIFSQVSLILLFLKEKLKK